MDGDAHTAGRVYACICSGQPLGIDANRLAECAVCGYESEMIVHMEIWQFMYSRLGPARRAIGNFRAIPAAAVHRRTFASIFFFVRSVVLPRQMHLMRAKCNAKSRKQRTTKLMCSSNAKAIYH